MIFRFRHIQSLLSRSTTQICRRIEPSAKRKRKNGKKKETKKKNTLETTWLFVCFNQIKDLDGFVCGLLAFFTVIFLDKFFGTHQSPMGRQRVQQQVLNSSSSSLKTISSPRTKLVRESCGALGAGQIRQLLLCSSSSSSSFLKMKTVISQ